MQAGTVIESAKEMSALLNNTFACNFTIPEAPSVCPKSEQCGLQQNNKFQINIIYEDVLSMLRHVLLVQQDLMALTVKLSITLPHLTPNQFL